jgi:uncharacterized phage protein (TIGR01671 family)
MNNRKLKFRFWSPAGKAFIKDYKYSGLVDELFDEKDFDTLIPQQFIGLLDKNGKEIYEGDLVNFKTNNTVCLGDLDVMEWESEEVYWDDYFCSFCFERRYATTVYDKVMLETLEVVGNVFENPEKVKYYSEEEI